MPDISVREITKSFPGTLAVDHVSIDFHAGEIHAILGENGAGKSTLMHLVSGLYRPDSGTILVNGQPHLFPSPRAALAAEIAMVHQHFHADSFVYYCGKHLARTSRLQPESR